MTCKRQRRVGSMSSLMQENRESNGRFLEPTSQYPRAGAGE
jgi:hypothetical protein